MRFHVGFSKRISLKTIIEILGFIFIGLLAFLGIDKAHADTLNHFDFYDPNNWGSYDTVLTGSYTYALTTSPSEDVFVNDLPLYQYEIWQGGSLSNRFFCFSSTCDNTESLFGYSYNSSLYNYQGDPMRVFKNASFGYSNENYCDVNDYKSNELYVYLRYNYDSYSSSFMSNNNFTPGDIWEMKFNAIDSNGEYYVTYCSYTGEQVVNSSINEAIYYCPNTFIGNNNVTIDNYSIDIFNKLSQDGDYILSGTYNYFNTNISIDLLNTTYQCTFNDPTIDFTTAETLPTKPDIDNVIKEAKENYVPNLPGINTDLFDIEYPSNIQELLSLPLYVLDNIVERSYTCTPYELDLSSLTTLGNNYSETKITFPCMRTELSSLLGTLYNLIDILMAAIVFYNIAMAIIQLIEAITDGVDLWSFYFTGTDEGRKFRLWFWGDMK